LLVAVVAALTLAIRAHEVPLGAFAASAAKIAAGEIWLLPASALVVDRPLYVGLVAFGLLGFAALWICGTRVFWVAAVVGHVGSTLAVYAIIGASRLTDPDVFASAAWWIHPDPSILTTEHLFAFLIGCGVVSWPRRHRDERRSAASPRRRAETPRRPADQRARPSLERVQSSCSW